MPQPSEEEQQAALAVAREEAHASAPRFNEAEPLVGDYTR